MRVVRQRRGLGAERVATRADQTPQLGWGSGRVDHHQTGPRCVGIGLDATGRQAIVIGLDRPRPETQATLPTQLEGYPVRVEIIGAVKAQ